MSRMTPLAYFPTQNSLVWLCAPGQGPDNCLQENDMSTSLPIANVSPQVRDTFDEACRAVFKTHSQRPMLEYKSRDLLQRFAAHYQHLSALPRRMRRALERRWKAP